MAAPYEIGKGPDAVSLVLGGDVITTWLSYTVKLSVFDTPATFALRLGWGETARELIAKYPKRTPFELYVGGLRQMTGRLDAREVPGGGYTELDLRGRCNMAALEDDYLESEQSYSESSYLQLAQKQVEAVGFQASSITGSNTANRKAITGAKRITETKPARTNETGEIVVEATSSSRVIRSTLKAQLGENRNGFLEREFKRAGLFMWSAADGGFVLSEPNANQNAIYGLVRERDVRTPATNIISCRWKDDGAQRHQEALVHGRKGGGKKGRAKLEGRYVDEELKALEYTNRITVEDNDCKSKAQCEFAARRRVSEERRRGWTLEYTVSGHSTLPTDMETERIIWAPDTVAFVDDRELGITGPHYIHSVTFTNDGKATTTQLGLMRPEDLVFAEEMETGT